MTTPKKSEQEWINTFWGKLAMIGITAVVVTFSNGIINSASNLTKIGQYIVKTDSLDKRVSFLEQQRTYGEMLARARLQAQRESEEKKLIEDKRYNDSLILETKRFNRWIKQIKK